MTAETGLTMPRRFWMLVSALSDRRSIAARLGDVSFLKGAAVLQVGSLGVTAVSFAASVLLARALGPTGFGTYSLVMSGGTTIGLLRRLGQDYAATTRAAEGFGSGDRRLIGDALAFYVFLSVATSLVVLPPAVALSPWLASRFLDESNAGVLLQLYLVQGFWAVVPGATVIALQASRRLGTLVRFENATTAISSLVPVALAVAGWGVIGVFVGQVAASLIGLVLGGFAYLRLVRAEPLLPDIRQLLGAALRPKIALWPATRFGLSIAVDKNLVSLVNLVPLLLLGWLASESEVGLLRVALSFMAIPAVLLAPVSRLLMVDLPRLHAVAPDRVRDFFLRVTVIGVMASAAISVPFWLASGLAVPLLYGSEFAAAAPLTLVLLLDAATLGLGIAAGPIFRTYNRTDLPIRATLAILVVGLPAAHAATSTWGAGGAALAYAGMTFVSRAVSYVQCLRVIGR